MVLKYIKFFCLILIVIYTFTYLYYKKKHKFWSKQPVSHFYHLQFKEGYISNIIEEPIHIDNNLKMEISNKLTNSNEIKEFLNNYYYQDKEYKYIYTNKQINHLFTDKFNYKIIKIKTFNNELIGLISSKIYKINIQNTILDIAYIDFLCINNKYISKKLAPVLISNIRYQNNLDGIKSFIFKIEKYKLPFNYL